MKTVFSKRLILILVVVNSILWCMGFSLMMINNGVIHMKPFQAPVDAELIYSGAYIDLLTLDQRSVPLENGETRVIKIDTQTGYPAALELALVDSAGRQILRTNVVRFNFQGMPAMLRFTNDVADGFSYQDTVFKLLEIGCLDDMNGIWETDPDFLRQALADYTAQVSALVE